MISVYRIKTFDTFGNSHSTNRDESWSVHKDETFDTLEEAEKYVIEKSLIHTEMATYSFELSKDEKQDFYRRFCFDNEDDTFLTKRRYFIEYPDIKKIKQMLKKESVQVINTIKR